MQEIRDPQVSVSAVVPSGKKQISGVLDVKLFARSAVDRYADAFLEGGEIRADDLAIVVDKAMAVTDGKPTDLLKENALTSRDFKPFKILIGK